MSDKFQRVEYSNPFFFSNKKIIVDLDFVPALNRISVYVDECKLKIFVTSSFRMPSDLIKGAIVSQAKKSCHYVGHAFDHNLQCDNGEWINSYRMRDFDKLPESVKSFYNMIRNDEELRWGGDFTYWDGVHIDDNIYHRNENLYLKKIGSI